MSMISTANMASLVGGGMVDAQAERRFQQLKKRLDALHYCQPLSNNQLFIDNHY